MVFSLNTSHKESHIFKDDKVFQFQHNGTFEQSTLIANPWNYIIGHLDYMIDENQRRTKFVTALKEARYYIKLSEELYVSSANAKLPAKGILYYYFILNLVKAYLAAKGILRNGDTMHHGISFHKENSSLKIITGDHSIFKKFTQALSNNDNINTTYLKLKDIINNIPSLQSISTNLNYIDKEMFQPVNIELHGRESKNRKFVSIYSTCTTKIGNKLLDTDKNFRKISDNNEHNYKYRTKEKRLTIKKFKAGEWCRQLSNIINYYDNVKICSILSSSGYRYYIPRTKMEFNHLSYELLLAFYIGHVTRYEPALVEHNLSGIRLSILSEALEISPKQFLYHMTNLITKDICLIPYAKI